MAPPMAASFAASFLLLPQPLMVPSSSPAALPQTPPLLSSSVLESRYFFSSGVVTESSTMRISALPLMRPAGLMNAIWPLTMLPSGTTVVPPETTGSFTTPANVSPGLFVLDVIVVSSRMRSMVPGGIPGSSAALALRQGKTAVKIRATNVDKTRFMASSVFESRCRSNPRVLAAAGVNLSPRSRLNLHPHILPAIARFFFFMFRFAGPSTGCTVVRRYRRPQESWQGIRQLSAQRSNVCRQGRAGSRQIDRCFRPEGRRSYKTTPPYPAEASVDDRRSAVRTPPP